MVEVRHRRSAAGTLVLYRRRPSGVHATQILAVTRDRLEYFFAAGDFVFEPPPIARISWPPMHSAIFVAEVTIAKLTIHRNG